MLSESLHTPVVLIEDERIDRYGVALYLKREDLTDPVISGNKYRKLLYNLKSASHLGHNTLLTFGGAYSNHIHAAAYAGKRFGFRTIGIIRGEKTLPLNATLADAAAFGMELYYTSRVEYRDKANPDFIYELHNRFGEFYLVPEGGSNALAVKGCVQILAEEEKSFDYYCCACGTGGTISGIIASLDSKKEVLGFPALKGGEFLQKDIAQLISSYNGRTYLNWQLMTEYHFGGYAKWDLHLIDFINRFHSIHQIALDPVYTGKMLFGVFDLIKKGFFPRGTRIMAIHTGGLQGTRGFNQRFGNIISTEHP